MSNAIPPDVLANWVNTVGNEIFQHLRVQAQLHFNYSGSDTPPVAGMVTSRTGRLLRSIMGTGARDRGDSVADIIPNPNGVDILWGTRVIYSALHEGGGTRGITPKMRKFYWAMFYLNRWGKKEMWKTLALFKTTVTFPPRPYLRPAIEDSQAMIKESVEKQWGQLIKFTIERIADEANKTQK